MTDEWYYACRIDDIPEGRGVSRFLAETPVGILRSGNAIHAFFGLCPHANGPIGRGWIEGDELVCPLHRWRFRLDDGAGTTVPECSLAKYPVEVRDGEVWVLMPQPEQDA